MTDIPMYHEGSRGLVVNPQVGTSDYAPCEGHTPPIPEWKTRPVFNVVLPPGDLAR